MRFFTIAGKFKHYKFFNYVFYATLKKITLDIQYFNLNKIKLNKYIKILLGT